MMYSTDELYGLSLTKFEAQLKQETGVDISTLKRVLEFEIKMLRQNYINLANNREVELDANLIKAIETALNKKREKLAQYTKELNAK